MHYSFIVRCGKANRVLIYKAYFVCAIKTDFYCSVACLVELYLAAPMLMCPDSSGNNVSVRKYAGLKYYKRLKWSCLNQLSSHFPISSTLNHRASSPIILFQSQLFKELLSLNFYHKMKFSVAATAAISAFAVPTVFASQVPVLPSHPRSTQVTYIM